MCWETILHGSHIPALLWAEALAALVLDYLFNDVCRANSLDRENVSPPGADSWLNPGSSGSSRVKSTWRCYLAPRAWPYGSWDSGNWDTWQLLSLSSGVLWTLTRCPTSSASYHESWQANEVACKSRKISDLTVLDVTILGRLQKTLPQVICCILGFSRESWLRKSLG